MKAGKKQNKNVRESTKPISILRLVLSIGETNAAYNQFSLALSDTYDITLCTFFVPDVKPPESITVFGGDNSFIGFFRALKYALAAKEYEIIHAHTPHVGFLFLMFTMFKSRKPMSATFFTLHTSFPNYKLRHKLLSVPVFAFFQRIVCCSQASYDSLPTLYKRLASGGLYVIRNGVDIDRIDHVVGDKRQYLHSDRFSVATVGRLIDLKNPLSALSAFHQAADPDSRLKFIGDGHLRDLLLIKRDAFGRREQVELTGLIRREEVYKDLSKTDLFVSTSRVEGLPVAVLEAMACRCPVVLSDIAAHREIAEGVDFIPLIHPDDVEGLANEIRKVRRMPVAEVAEIGEKCRKLVEERFSLSSMHKAYHELYANTY